MNEAKLQIDGETAAARHRQARLARVRSWTQALPRAMMGGWMPRRNPGIVTEGPPPLFAAGGQR